MRSFRTVYIYTYREFLISFVVAFLFFFFLFFVNNILLLAEEVLSKDVPPLDVLMLIIFSLPSVLSISFPFAALVGALMAVGRLSADNEILALKASGVHRIRVFIPLVLSALILTAVSFVMNDYFIPAGNINFGKLYTQVFFANPELELESFSVKRYQDAVIVTGSVEGGEISDILIIDKDAEQDKRVISASRATLAPDEGQRGVISLQLEDVLSHTADQNKRLTFEYSESERMTYNILLQDISFSVRNPGPREMSSVDVWKVIQEKRAAFAEKQQQHDQKVEQKAFELAAAYRYVSPLGSGSGAESDAELARIYQDFRTLSERKLIDRSLQNYEIEFHKKFSLPVACLVFIVFGFPVGLLTKRSGRAVGFGLGLFVAIAYWGMLFAGQQIGYRLSISPIVSSWFPNAVILVLGVTFTLVRRNR